MLGFRVYALTTRTIQARSFHHGRRETIVGFRAYSFASGDPHRRLQVFTRLIWEIPKIRGTLFGVLIIGILLLGYHIRVPIFGNSHLVI